MKFQANSRRTPIEYEKDLVKYWKDNQVFEKSIQQRPADNTYVFYDGPPFITGEPHHGTLLSSIVKDAVPRYQTMKGKRVERKWGWDCHGLPAEVFTEVKLGIKDKRDIGTKISLEEYITTCRDNMVATGDLWEGTIDRIGRWVDFKGAYKTMDRDYMESVWWAFKQLYESGKIYEGEKVLLYCTRDATPISKAEVAMDNSYQDVTDPSVYVKFKLDKEGKKNYYQNLREPSSKLYDSNNQDAKTAELERQEEFKASIDKSDESQEDVYLLGWTTTPWTLPANTALAIWSQLEYSEVRVGDDRFIVATSLIDKIFIEENKQKIPYEVTIPSFSGNRLVGLSYEPLFENRGGKAHLVWDADYVSDNEGTGIVHLAPAYGEEDFDLAKQEGFPVVSMVDENGFYDSGRWKDQQVWDVNKEIAKTLHQEGVIWKIDYIKHSYPHCHRCGTKLMYRAHPSWFMDIDGQRQEMIEQDQDIYWFPEHIKHGRWQKTIESAPDWNLSRDRFWATAMPVWKGVDDKGKEHIKVVGSYEELKSLSGQELDDYHRPWVDEITFEIDGVEYRRIDKVLDCWFESGSMPFAQFHYPFENKDKFEASFPGDFIVEYVGQVRAWFYYMHAVSVGLFGKNAFKNVIVTGTLAGNDGRKMSKSYSNYTNPNELMDDFSADALRFLLLSSPVLAGEDFSLIEKDVGDVQRKLNMLMNVYDFFTMYASVDGWEWNGSLDSPTDSVTNLLDRWVLSRVHQTNKIVDEEMSQYDLPSATKPLLGLVEDISNWYVRRSRKRFWKSEDDQDKADAYQTLHYVLAQTAIIFAPFTPFLSEELYRNLTGGESVHLIDWPKAGEVDENLISQMAVVRNLIKQGLESRATSGIKVRQPLSKAKVSLSQEINEGLIEIIKDELNVKKVEFDLTKADEGVVAGTISLDKNITAELRREGYMREIVRHVQQFRKESGLEVDDRINLVLNTSDKQLSQAISDYQDVIKSETLAKSVDDQGETDKKVDIDGNNLDIGLNKV